MTAIKFKDTTTDVWHSVPAIKGDKGDKGDTGAAGADGAAGPSAVYVGTDEPAEADIRIWLDTDGAESAGEIFWIHLEDGTPYVADKTYDEIVAAVEDGLLPIVTWTNNSKYHNAVFAGWNESSQLVFKTGVYSQNYVSLMCSSSDVWTRSQIWCATGIDANESSHTAFPSCKATADYIKARGPVFWITVTVSGSAYTADKTYAEITAAITAGYIPWVKMVKRNRDHCLRFCMTRDDGTLVFSCHYDSQTMGIIIIGSDGTVDGGYSRFEKSTNKVTTIEGNESSDTYYPTTKAVADYVAEHSGGGNSWELIDTYEVAAGTAFDRTQTTGGEDYDFSKVLVWINTVSSSTTFGNAFNLYTYDSAGTSALIAVSSATAKTTIASSDGFDSWFNSTSTTITPGSGSTNVTKSQAKSAGFVVMDGGIARIAIDTAPIYAYTVTLYAIRN